jgi:hypothetical protein
VPHAAAARVSGNVDQDEERAAQTAAGPRTVNLAAAPHPSAPPPVRPSRLTGDAQHPVVPHVSSNVDLDEETLR